MSGSTGDGDTTEDGSADASASASTRTDVEAKAGEHRHVGSARERREDPALVRGEGSFTDDRADPETAHLAFVRSRYAHARIEGVETDAATAMDGVLAAYTWADIAASEAPGRMSVPRERLNGDLAGHPTLADDRVRYQGQPVAAVVAETRGRAADAAAAVEVAYDPLEPVVETDAATDADAPTLFESCPDNVAASEELGDPEATETAFAAADRTVELDLTNNRLIANALEPRAALARPEGDRLRVDLSSQGPHGHRSDLADALGMDEQDLRVVAPDVGGGFGHKGHHHPGETMTAWAARRLDRAVKWTASRSENYQAGAHGRDHVTTCALAFDEDGTVRGLRAETTAAAGGYPLGSGPLLPLWYGRLLAGQYEIPAIHCRTQTVFTNTAPVHSYRGAGRPEAIYVLERLVRRAADDLGMDPAAFRRRNLLPPDAFPVETAVGATYDSGDYEPALEKAIELVGYDELRGRETPPAEDDDRLVGVGLACYVESTGGGFESGLVRVHPDGGVVVFAGTHSHGQGHATTYAQVVADELGVDPEDVDVVEGDTDRVPSGTGTFGSRSTVVGGGAVHEAARTVRERALELAAGELEADPADLELADGAVRVVGAPERSVAFADVAAAAYGYDRPEGVAAGLEATSFYEPDGTAYTFGTHAAVVAIDRETGEVEVVDYVAVDDCGVRINPRIVEGQVHGGVAQGIGQALHERASYDENGNLTSATLTDYHVPRATDLPTVRTAATETPSPTNPLGVKGIGEAGTIAAPPAVVNAVVDALAPFDVDHVDMPVTPGRVWRAMQE